VSDGGAPRAPWLWVSAARLGVALALTTLWALGCATPRKQRPPEGPKEEGIASHYAERFAGRPTASGAIYSPRAMTAAHKTLPLGTRVRVIRIDREGARVAGPIEVLINDRGPYAKGRIIDLSSAAARQLGIYGGIARVRIEVIQLPTQRR
jgi:rare lipoprotein A